jgi:DNA-binding transcriptional MerR regulator
MAKQAGVRSGGPTPPAPEGIPDKLYFRIGEVAALCKVETYVLRFWQTEFPQLKPVKSGTGQRLYRRRDVEMALRIKHLLHEEGYTIAGARHVFAAEASQYRQHPQARSQPELPLAPAPESRESQNLAATGMADRAADRAQSCLAHLRLELAELHGLLSRPPAKEPVPPTRAHRKGHATNEGSLFGEAGNFGDGPNEAQS